jgi:putative tryptophan/tyrosine transport system substrate-binding protein
MRRREFVMLLSGAAAVAPAYWPLAAHAQQAATPVIGFLSVGTSESNHDYVAAFHRGLADGGFAEGRNVGIEYRWSEGHNDRLPALAEDLVREPVTVIAVNAHQVRWLLRRRLKQPRSFFILAPTQLDSVSSRVWRTLAAISLALPT